VNTYPAGALVRVATYSGTIASPVGGFRDASGNLADPTVVTLQYRAGPPGQPVTTVTYPASPVVRDAPGLYHADLDTTASPTAVWTYWWDGTGAVQAPASNTFSVQGKPL
jgi:hypothetical protein